MHLHRSALARLAHRFGHCVVPTLLLALLSPAHAWDDLDALRAEVTAAERAFAQTMADRDHAAFQRFVDDEAIFVGGPRVFRGKADVAAGWKAFFADARAPFSWQPLRVEVLASGTLAFSCGPVFDAEGQRVSAFSSVWRRQAPGVWKVVFDQSAERVDCRTDAPDMSP